jgi:hypothetical protein
LYNKSHKYNLKLDKMQLTEQAQRPLKWPEKLRALKVGQSIDANSWEAVAARMAKSRLEKKTRMRFTSKSNRHTGKVTLVRLPDATKEELAAA